MYYFNILRTSKISNMDLIKSEFGVIDYTVLILMLIVSAIIGIYFGCVGKKIQTTDDYLLGNRKMKAIPIGISLLASQMSAFVIIAMPAEVYAFGIHTWLLIVSLAILTVLTNYIFLPVFYVNKLSDCFEYLELRFSKTIRVMITILYMLSAILLLPITIFLSSLALAQVTDYNVHLINGISCAVCMFYTIIGGIKAVVWTDVFQAGVMVFSMIVIVVLGIIAVGGFTEVWDRSLAGNRIYLFDMTVDLTTRQTFWNVVSSGIVGYGAYITFNQNCVQRLASVPTMKQAKIASTIFFVGTILIFSICCFAGLIMYAYFHECDPIRLKIVRKPDKLISHFISKIAGHLKGMAGLFIACMFSASLSTMSANFNSLAGVIYFGFIKSLTFYKHTEKKANIIMKFIIFLLGFYSIFMGLIVAKYSSVYQILTTIKGLTNGTIFGIFTLGILYPWANKKAIFWSIIINTIVMGWIIIGAQIYIAQGKLTYNSLSTTIDNCPNINVTSFKITEISLRNETHPLMQDKDESFSIYKLSFMWYSFFGFIIMWVICVPLCHLIGTKDVQKLNQNLIATIAKSLIPSQLKPKEFKMKNMHRKYTVTADEEIEHLNKANNDSK